MALRLEANRSLGITGQHDPYYREAFTGLFPNGDQRKKRMIPENLAL
jgi:hypothetical protein